jgi:hypothetical protein
MVRIGDGLLLDCIAWLGLEHFQVSAFDRGYVVGKVMVSVD